MKIVYWSDATLPSRAANTVHVMKMGQALADNENSVDLIAHRKDNKADEEEIFGYYGIRRIFNLRLVDFPKIHGGGVLYAIKGLRYVRKNSPDLIYGRSVYGCFLTSFFTNIPVIFEAHDKMENKRLFCKLFERMIKKRNFMRLVVITQRLADYYENSYPELEGKVLVAPDGADAVAWNKLLDVEIKENDNVRFNIGYIGSLYKGRGIDIILKMAELLPKDRFHVIGGSDIEVEEWKKKACSLCNVIFYGQVAPAMVVSYGCKMDILIAPYQKNVYSSNTGNTTNTVDYMSPMKIFEYMSFGKAVLASDLIAIREVLENDRDSILCNPDKIDEWVNAVERLYMEKGLAERISKKALEEFLENYTWKERARRVVLGYENR